MSYSMSWWNKETHRGSPFGIFFNAFYLAFMDLRLCDANKFRHFRPQVVSGASWRAALPRWIIRLGCKGPGVPFRLTGMQIMQSILQWQVIALWDAASEQTSSTAKGTGWHTTLTWPKQEESALAPQRDKHRKLFPVQDEGVMNLDIWDLAKHETLSYHWLMCTSEGQIWKLH